MGMVIFFFCNATSDFQSQALFPLPVLELTEGPTAVVITDSRNTITYTGLSLEAKLDSVCVQQEITLAVGEHPCLTNKISFLRCMGLNFLWKSPPKDLKVIPDVCSHIFSVLSLHFSTLQPVPSFELPSSWFSACMSMLLC